MPASCPYCQQRIAPSNPKPGRFRIPCPGCAKAFALIIPVQPDAAWVCKPLSGEIAAPGLMASRTVSNRPAKPSGSAVLDHPPSRTRKTGIGDTPLPPAKPNAAALSSRRSPASSIPDDSDDLSPTTPPSNIPGYRVESILGVGGMGTVYLARQLSLDRPVALKVMSKRWVHDPVFVARFTREAFAAALLNHPNVVQIYDIGEAGGARFFSMEYVPGQSLVDLVKAEGKLDPETAVGFLLQAARGLKHAHDRGMIHRDVKPDNLLLDEQGMVKVADLGLVKTQDLAREQDRLSDPAESGHGLNSLPMNMTGTRMALGTPAYMAPEQCRDAAMVDHRADIYSLGCTLYVLVTGKQPFDGNTAIELMTKHAYEPIVPPDMIASRVPKELSAVIQKMMAKNADDRFPSMGEVIRTLEQWLGVHHTGTFNPHDDQIENLEKHVRSFNEAPAAILRSRAIGGSISAALLAAVLLTFFGQLGWAFGIASMVIQTALAYFVVDGIARKTYFFRRVRQFAFGLMLGDIAVLVAGLGLFAVLLWMFNLFWMFAGFGFIGVGIAIGLRIWLDRAVDAQRQVPLETSERMLRRMRLHGVDEEEIRQFVAKFAGRTWEEFFEALFGFEAKLSTRGVLLRGGYAGVRDKFAGWREPILNLIDRAEKARKESRERKLLAQVEQARLLAAGVSADAARDRAAEAANVLVKQANAYRFADARRRTVPSGGIAFPTAVGMPNLGQILQQSTQENSFDFREEAPKRDALRFLANLVLGPHVRALVAAVLLAASALWVYQNRLFFDADFSAEAAKAAETQQLADIEHQAAGLERKTFPLAIDGLPPEWTTWCDSANAAWAGVLLLASLFYRGNRMSAFVLLGSVVCVLGHRFGIRTVEPIRAFHVALLLGTVLSLIGYRIGRR